MKRAKITAVKIWKHALGFAIITKHGYIAISGRVASARIRYHFPHLYKEILVKTPAELSFLVGRYCYYNEIKEIVRDDRFIDKILF